MVDKHMALYTDASVVNGRAFSGFCVMRAGEIVEVITWYTGQVTTMQAEFMAVTRAIEHAVDAGATRVTIFCDNIHVVSTASRPEPPVDASITRLHQTVRGLWRRLSALVFVIIPSRRNLAHASVNHAARHFAQTQGIEP